MLRRRNWPVFFAGTMLVLTLLLFEWYRDIGNLTGDLLGNHPRGKFFYWSLYYPNLAWFVIPFGTLFLIIWAIQKRQKKFTKVFQFTLLAMLVATVFMCGWFFWMVMTIVEEPSASHISTVQTGDVTHHAGVIADIGGSRFLLFKCDRFGWMCEVAYSMTSGKAELIVDVQYRPVFQLLVDGKPVYSYSSNH